MEMFQILLIVGVVYFIVFELFQVYNINKIMDYVKNKQQSEWVKTKTFKYWIGSGFVYFLFCFICLFTKLYLPFLGIILLTMIPKKESKFFRLIDYYLSCVFLIIALAMLV